MMRVSTVGLLGGFIDLPFFRARRSLRYCSGRLVGAAAGGRTMVMSPPASISFS
jgi:hypothetical protein